MLTVGHVAPQPGEVLCCRKNLTYLLLQVREMRMQAKRFCVLQPALLDVTAGGMRQEKQMSAMCSVKKKMLYSRQNAAHE
jgi:hypothetical protein